MRTLFLVLTALTTLSASALDTIALGRLQLKQIAYVPRTSLLVGLGTEYGNGTSFTMSVRAWDTTSGRSSVIYSREYHELSAVAVSPGGGFLAVATLHGGRPALQVWRIASNTFERIVELDLPDASVHGLAFVSETQLVFSDYRPGAGWALRSYDVRSRTLGERNVHRDLDVRGLVAFPGGQVAARDAGDALVFWQPAPVRLIRRLVRPLGEEVHNPDPAHGGPVTAAGAVDVSPEGSIQLTVDPTWRHVTLASASQVRQRSVPDRIASWAFSTDAHSLALVSAEGIVTVLDTGTANSVATRPSDVRHSGATKPVFSPDGRILAVPGERAVRLVRVR